MMRLFGSWLTRDHQSICPKSACDRGYKIIVLQQINLQETDPTKMIAMNCHTVICRYVELGKKR